MQFRFNFQGLPKSPSLCEYTEGHLKKHIAKFVSEAGVTEVHFSQSGGAFAATGQLDTARSLKLRARADSDNPYAAAYMMVFRLAEQVRRSKDRKRSHHDRSFEHHNQGSVH